MSDPLEDSQARAKEFNALVDKHVADLVRKHALAVENLTEQQLAEAIRQAIACGDFKRNVVVMGDIKTIQDDPRLCPTTQRQSVTYIPYQREQELESEIGRLRAQIAVKDECLRHFAKKYEGRPLTTEEHGAQNWIHQALTADGSELLEELKRYRKALKLIRDYYSGSGYIGNIADEALKP